MTLPTYSTGTASVAAGGTVVTGVGGLWSGVNVKQGDFISIGGSDAVLITEVTDTTHLKVSPWPDAAKTGQPYIIYQNFVGRVVGVAAAEDVGVMLEKLHTDGLPFILDPSETVPDPSYGDDGQFAFQPSTGQWWTKTGGAWVSSPGLTGNVSGPGSAINDHLVLFNGSSGTVIKDSGKTINQVVDFVTVAAFGAVGDGVTDDRAAIQAAINTGKVVRLAANTTYAIGASLTIGNGTAATLSSQNGIRIEGSTSGTSAVETSPVALATRLKWIGAAAGIMLNVNGPVSGVCLVGLVFDCNSLANTAIHCKHMMISTWVDVLAVNYKSFAFLLESYTEFSGLAQGANKNSFTNLRALAPAASGSGIRVGSLSKTGNLDVAQNLFLNCQFHRDGASVTSTSLQLSYCDNLTFIECETGASFGSSGVGVYVKPPSGASGVNFPQEILFLNCPAMSGFTVDGSWVPLNRSGISCYPYPVNDSEPIPSATGISGATFDNRFFGHWALALAATVAPSNNGDLEIQLSSNTSLTFVVKGNDGTVRTASLTLS